MRIPCVTRCCHGWGTRRTAELNSWRLEEGRSVVARAAALHPSVERKRLRRRCFIGPAEAVLFRSCADGESWIGENLFERKRGSRVHAYRRSRDD
jgi:hypothetical protein